MTNSEKKKKKAKSFQGKYAWFGEEYCKESIPKSHPKNYKQ